MEVGKMKVSDVSYLPPEIARTLLPPGYARPPFCLDDDYGETVADARADDRRPGGVEDDEEEEEV
jgi:hypothetical protein